MICLHGLDPFFKVGLVVHVEDSLFRPIFIFGDFFVSCGDLLVGLVTAVELSAVPSCNEEGVDAGIGNEYKIDGPVSCIRTEIARDGIEDFEYLSLIEKYIGKDKADEFTARLVTNVETFVTEPETLYEVRREMAKLLESAMK